MAAQPMIGLPQVMSILVTENKPNRNTKIANASIAIKLMFTAVPSNPLCDKMKRAEQARERLPALTTTRN